MGRSRGVSNSTDEDSNQRSKRRRVASSGENSEALATGPGTSEGKKALYHCNYCNKDISGKIRIKCTKCPDFDLCVECFSVGAEVTPHKSNHPYRVMDNLSFPLIFPDWNADEEILLLEGIEMYGLGNWAEVAEHVGTKSKAQCIDHYTTAYMNSPCYPLPDMSRVNGKNRKELLAMAKVQGEGKKGLRQKLRCTACFSEQPVTSSCFEEFSMCNTGKAGISMLGDVMPKEESPFSPSRVKIEDLSEALAGRSPSGLNSGASKKASNVGQFKDGSDGIKVEGLTSTKDLHMDRSVGVKKPKYSGDEGPSMKALSGFNVKRQEFDPEYDNFAEKPLADMEFKETDSETDRELKLRVLRIYLSRLDERKRRKEFILERKLLYPNPLENELSSEDREAYQRFKVFMRFLSQEEYGTLMKTVIEERKIRRRIQELQECRAAGCRTLAEVKMYTEQKRKKELETSAQKLKEAGQIVASGKAVQKANRPMNREKGESDGSPRNSIDNHKLRGGTGLEPGGKDSPISQASTKSFDEWNITGLPGTELLSESEQQLCCQSRLLPSLYLKMQEVLVQEILKGSVGKKSDAHPLFNVDPSKVDKVYDIVTKKLGQHEEVANI